MNSYYKHFYSLGCFTRGEVLEKTSNSKVADSVLFALKKKGLVMSVKRNLYVAVSGETGLIVPNAYQIASKITTNSYVSHHSAFEYFGLTNQVFTEVGVSSTSRFNDFEFDGKIYRHIPSKLDDGVISPNDKMRVTNLERTIVDNVKDFSKSGGLEELLRCLDMVTFVNEGALLSYLAAYENQFLYQKTGYILSHFKNSMKLSEHFFKECKSKIKKSVRYLQDGAQNAVFYPEWQILAPANLMRIIHDGGDEIV